MSSTKFLTELADAVRKLLNITDKLKPSVMIEYIKSVINADFVADNSITEYRSDRLTSLRNYAFTNCTNLTTIDLPNVINIGNRAFSNCLSLVNVNISKVRIINEYSFYYCKKIETLRFPIVYEIRGNAFDQCSQLNTLILTYSNVVKLTSTSALSNTSIASGNGYIYVPDALVNSYKTATNWTVYADQIKSINELENS